MPDGLYPPEGNSSWKPRPVARPETHCEGIVLTAGGRAECTHTAFINVDGRRYCAECYRAYRERGRLWRVR